MYAISDIEKSTLINSWKTKFHQAKSLYMVVGLNFKTRINCNKNQTQARYSKKGTASYLLIWTEWHQREDLMISIQYSHYSDKMLDMNNSDRVAYIWTTLHRIYQSWIRWYAWYTTNFNMFLLSVQLIKSYLQNYPKGQRVLHRVNYEKYNRNFIYDVHNRNTVRNSINSI